MLIRYFVRFWLLRGLASCVQLPPGVNFGMSLKRPVITQGIFGLSSTHSVKILQKIKSGTSHFKHHTSHIEYAIVIFKESALWAKFL